VTERRGHNESEALIFDTRLPSRNILVGMWREFYLVNYFLAYSAVKGKEYESNLCFVKRNSIFMYKKPPTFVTRIIQSLYYSPASCCINAWMH
jgi:hypothetical protein